MRGRGRRFSAKSRSAARAQASRSLIIETTGAVRRAARRPGAVSTRLCQRVRPRPRPRPEEDNTCPAQEHLVAFMHYGTVTHFTDSLCARAFVTARNCPVPLTQPELNAAFCIWFAFYPIARSGSRLLSILRFDRLKLKNSLRISGSTDFSFHPLRTPLRNPGVYNIAILI